MSGGKEKERTKESQKEKEKALESTAKEKEEKEKVMEKEKASTTKRAKDEEKEEEKEKEKVEDEDTAKAGAEDTTTKEKEKATTTTTQEPTSVTTARSLDTTKPTVDLNRETCRMPGTYRRMMNRACEHKPQTVPSSSASATTSRTTAAKSTAKPTVRQIAMYHMGDEPENFPEVFELDEDEEELEIEYFGRILRVTEAEEFCLSSGEESEIEQEEDPLLDWYLGREQLPRELQQAHVNSNKLKKFFLFEQ